MNLKDKLKNSILVLDGAMGTQLQAAGLPLGTLPEEWNITHPDKVVSIHRAYLEAGADIIYANTFGANALKFNDVEGVVRAAISCAKSAAAGFKDKFIALDVGPLGKLIKPLGDLDFEEAVSIFKRTVSAGAVAGADLVVIETMNDCYELKAAIVAAKECCSLPVFASMVFGSDEKTMTGTSPEAFVCLAEGLGVDALGVNCSLAPAQMEGVISRIAAVSSTPVLVKPNAGIPEEVEGKTHYSLKAGQFAKDMQKLMKLGAQVLGGCCGTTPEYIKALKGVADGCKPAEVADKKLTAICSYTHAVTFGGDPVLIGERINPTGKKKLKEALRQDDIAYILNEAVKETEAGAHVLDVNVGLPEIDERDMLTRCVSEIQAVTDLPLQIDTSDPVAMESALRIYNGVPLLNSVNGKAESMQKIFPLAKKYGGVIICLTLDEGGIPPTAAGRIGVAEKIIKVAAEYGISKNRLIFDTLAMAVSADSGAANAAIESLDYIRHTLGCNTSLGVSNISFGLPQRDFINSTFLAMALARGLSAAIYNPFSQEMVKTYKCFMALTGKDENCLSYVGYASSVTAGEITLNGTPSSAAVKCEGDLKYAIVKGLKKESAERAEELLKESAPLDVINRYVIPALDEVGKGFEQKTVFLPQLLMSAEAASEAFKCVKARLNPADNAKKAVFVLATVKGDIHDIGKNIVATLLSNYGFTVHDLGRDVAPEEVVRAAKKHGAHAIGLSALMTTTVASMRETVELARRELPKVKICVGGAVLTEEYAAKIGADKYCRDAMETVRYAEELDKKL